MGSCTLKEALLSRKGKVQAREPVSQQFHPTKKTQENNMSCKCNQQTIYACPSHEDRHLKTLNG